MAHDVIMTPMDVCKQRLQLGYHRNSVIDCACAIMRAEGPRAFMISYPVTLGMNVPYALVMGTSNELLRRRINPTGEHSLSTYLLAGAGAGSSLNPGHSFQRIICHIIAIFYTFFP